MKTAAGFHLSDNEHLFTVSELFTDDLCHTDPKMLSDSEVFGSSGGANAQQP